MIGMMNLGVLINILVTAFLQAEAAMAERVPAPATRATQLIKYSIVERRKNIQLELPRDMARSHERRRNEISLTTPVCTCTNRLSPDRVLIGLTLDRSVGGGTAERGREAGILNAVCRGWETRANKQSGMPQHGANHSRLSYKLTENKTTFLQVSSLSASSEKTHALIIEVL